MIDHRRLEAKITLLDDLLQEARTILKVGVDSGTVKERLERTHDLVTQVEERLMDLLLESY